ncbi:MAG TPA: hypothetical protein VEP90_11445, partial [Methylomirabilota bacterium]|nr:hypothetical protein [Methylomirabilota bacterium]
IIHLPNPSLMCKQWYRHPPFGSSVSAVSLVQAYDASNTGLSRQPRSQEVALVFVRLKEVNTLSVSFTRFWSAAPQRRPLPPYIGIQMQPFLGNTFIR